jgi:hypothetical protein
MAAVRVGLELAVAAHQPPLAAGNMPVSHLDALTPPAITRRAPGVRDL